jgi:hypothetical protein
MRPVTRIHAEPGKSDFSEPVLELVEKLSRVVRPVWPSAIYGVFKGLFIQKWEN